MFRWICGLAWVFLVVEGTGLSAVLEVGQDKPYKTIRDAANACSPGDTIVVDPGVYLGPVQLQPQCTLTGAGPGRTVLIPYPFGPADCPLYGSRETLVQGLWLCAGWYAGVQGSPWFPSRLEDCVIWGNGAGVRCFGPGNHTFLTNCVIFGNEDGVVCGPSARATLFNTIVYGNARSFGGELANISATYSCVEGGWPGEGNINAHPIFANPEECNIFELIDRPETYSPWPDLRLRPNSPCIDAGFNDPDLPETDIAGMHRILFGGKSLTVDMGAYEYYINEVEPGPGADESTLTWSSLADKTYSIFYSDDLFTWHLAIDNFPSSGNGTTSWTDDGSLTGLAPSLAPKRFYRLIGP